MQFALLIVLSAAVGAAMRRIVFWRRCGFASAGKRLYRRVSLAVGLGAWGAMALQEALLALSGQLHWGNALPMHLCSLMGLLALPMLLWGNGVLWHASLFLGVPGAALALVFPAILPTPWPRLTALGFHLLHCLVILAPLLPLSLGRQPRPLGALWALAFLLVHALAALGINALTGGNYLFLSLPAAVTPLDALAAAGVGTYRLCLAALAVLVLALEALILWWVQRRPSRRRPRAAPPPRGP